MLQVLDSCLEVATTKSDSGKNAKACTADIKAANAKMLKLGHRVSCAFPFAWTKVPILTMSTLSYSLQDRVLVSILEGIPFFSFYSQEC